MGDGADDCFDRQFDDWCGLGADCEWDEDDICDLQAPRRRRTISKDPEIWTGKGWRHYKIAEMEANHVKAVIRMIGAWSAKTKDDDVQHTEADIVGEERWRNLQARLKSFAAEAFTFVDGDVTNS